jgi:hypothetical protein
MHTSGGANSRGIEHNTVINDLDTSGNKIYGNIVKNCLDVGYRFRYKDLGIFYDNIAYNCGISFYFHRQQGTKYGLKIEMKNNISLYPKVYHIYFQDLDHEAGISDNNCKIDSDYNLFYPNSGNLFYFYDSRGGGIKTFRQWQALSKTGCIFDTNSDKKKQ